MPQELAPKTAYSDKYLSNVLLEYMYNMQRGEQHIVLQSNVEYSGIKALWINGTIDLTIVDINDREIEYKGVTGLFLFSPKKIILKPEDESKVTGIY